MRLRPGADRDGGRVADDPEERLVRRTARRLGRRAAALTGALVVAMTAVGVLVVLDVEHGDARRQLAVAVERGEDVVDPPVGVWLIADEGGSRMATPGLPDGLADPAALDRVAATGVAETRAVTRDDQDFLVTTVRRDGHLVQGVLDLQATESATRRLVGALLLVGALGLVVAAAVGTWVSRRALDPLATALRRQTSFVADAGHELRTPLTLLSTRAQLLRRRLAEPGDARGVTLCPADGSGVLGEADALVADSAALAAVLDDLLHTAGPFDLRASGTVDVAAVVAGAVAAHAAAAAERGVEVRLVPPVAGSGAPRVRGSAGGLRRAVTDLLDNAVRHARGCVRVEVVTVRGEVRVAVVDDGDGLDPAARPGLLRRVGRGRPGRGRPGPARAGGRTPGRPTRRRYGLGLALVAGVAERHGGRVEAEDCPGGGAVLRLSLPAVS